jgi:hypothetical protein
MTLTRLLDINEALLNDLDVRGLTFAEILFQEAGAPSEKQALCKAIENILVKCQQEGVPYPAVLLKRKKQLQRGEWEPQHAQAKESGQFNIVPAAATAPKSEEEAIAEARRVYTPEPFERWQKLHEHAKRLCAAETVYVSSERVVVWFRNQVIAERRSEAKRISADDGADGEGRNDRALPAYYGRSRGTALRAFALGLRTHAASRRGPHPWLPPREILALSGGGCARVDRTPTASGSANA